MTILTNNTSEQVILMTLENTNEMTPDILKVAVIGAGHAGRGLASYLSIYGIDVTLFNRTFANIRAIRENGGIRVCGMYDTFAEITLITNNIRAAINDCQLIVVTVPAHTHSYYARIMAPHLQSGQVVLLMPGRTGGALEFMNTISYSSITRDVLVAEAETYSFVSRMVDEETVLLSKIKTSVEVSAFPAIRNKELLQALKPLPLNIKLAETVLETSFNNIGAMLHPTPTILSAGLLESRGGGYNHYHDAISPTVGRLLEKMDAERVRVAREFDTNPITLIEWLTSSYGARGTTLCECIKSIDAYDNVGSPSSLDHRYVLEDVPTGLVPISYFGKLAGIDTPTIDTVIDMACHLYDIDFWVEGRNIESLGLGGLSPLDVLHYVKTGELPEDMTVEQPLPDIFGLEVDEI